MIKIYEMSRSGEKIVVIEDLNQNQKNRSRLKSLVLVDDYLNNNFYPKHLRLFLSWDGVYIYMLTNNISSRVQSMN
jgi:hypothetical protein